LLAFPLALAVRAQPAPTSLEPAAVAPATAETPRERRRREQTAARAVVECRDITPTGSNMPGKVCRTRAQWEQLRQDSMSDYRTLREASPDALMRGR
jgi:hypothetical protein